MLSCGHESNHVTETSNNRQVKSKPLTNVTYNGPPPHRGHALHARLTPPTTPITCRHALLITLRAGGESLNQIWFMQHFSSDRRNFPGGHPSRDYSMESTLNYGVSIYMSSLKRVGQLLKDPGT